MSMQWEALTSKLFSLEVLMPNVRAATYMKDVNCIDLVGTYTVTDHLLKI